MLLRASKRRWVPVALFLACSLVAVAACICAPAEAQQLELVVAELERADTPPTVLEPVE